MVVLKTGKERFTGRNASGVSCVDFTRGGHRLRLEDLNVGKASRAGEGSRIEGSFTVTHRLRLLPDPHAYVTFVAENGKVKLNVRTDGEGSLDVPMDGGIVDDVRNFLTNIDARSAIASFVGSVIDEFEAATRKKLYVVEATTGKHKKARTNDRVWITLQGSGGSIERAQLDNPVVNDFERGDTNRFDLFLERDIGRLQRVTLEKAGENGWQVESIDVETPSDRNLVEFKVWLDNSDGNERRVTRTIK